MKKVLTTVILLLVVLSMVGGGVFWYLRQRTGPRVLSRAVVALRANNFHKAARMAERYSLRYPEDWRGHQVRGEALLRLARYEDARKPFQKAAKLNPTEVGPILGLASTYSLPAKRTLVRRDTGSPIEALKQTIDRFLRANEILLEPVPSTAAEGLDLRERLGRDLQSIASAWKAVGERLAEQAKTAEEVHFNFIAAVKREQSEMAFAESDNAIATAIKTLLEVIREDPSRDKGASALVELCIQSGDTRSLSLAREAIMGLENPPAIAAMQLALHDLKSAPEEMGDQRRQRLDKLCQTLDRLLKNNPDQLQVKLARAEAAFMVQDYVTAERICNEILKDNRRQARARLVRACIRMKKGEFAEAERQLFALKMDYPGWDEAHYTFALAALATGKKELAQRAMRTVTQLNPNHSQARAYLAETLMRSGFFDQGFIDAEAYYHGHPDDPTAVRLFVQGALGMSKPMREAARKALEKAQADYPDDIEMMMVVGEGYDRLGDKGRAREAFSRAVEHDPVSSAEHLAVARALQHIGRFAQAETILLQQLSQDPEMGDAQFELAQLYALTGRELQGIDRLQTAIRIDDRNTTYRVELARLWFNMGDLKQCERILDQIESADAEANLLRLRVKLLRRESVSPGEMLQQIDRTGQGGLALALTYLNTGRPDWCVNVCLAALKTTPDNRPLRLLLGQAYLLMGQKDKSLEQWSLALRTAPRQLPVYLSIAGILVAKHDPSQVEEMLSRIPYAEPDMIDLTMGWVHSRRGDFLTAGEVYRKLANRSEAPEFLRNRARLLCARALASGEEVDKGLTELDALPDDDYWKKAAMEEKAEILASVGRETEGLEVMNRLARTAANDKDAGTLRRMVRLMISIKRFTEALGLCDNIQGLRPHDPRSYLLRAEVLEVAGKKTEALDALEKAIELQPGDFKTYIILANTLDTLERPREVLETLHRMKALGTAGNARALFECAKVFSRWGLPTQTVQGFQEIDAQSYTNSPALQLVMGSALARVGSAEPARGILKEIPVHSPQYIRAQFTLMDLCETDEERLEILDRLSKTKPDHPGVFERKMRILMRSGNSDEAVRVLRSFLQHVKGARKVRAGVYLLGVRALLQSGDRGSACELARRVFRKTQSAQWRQLCILLGLDDRIGTVESMLPRVEEAGLCDALLGLIVAAQKKDAAANQEWAERVEHITRLVSQKEKRITVPPKYRILGALIAHPGSQRTGRLEKLIQAVNVGRLPATELVSRITAQPKASSEAVKLLKATLAIDMEAVGLGRTWGMEVLQNRPTCQWAAALVMQTRPDTLTHKKVATILQPPDCALALRIQGSLFRNSGAYEKAGELYGRAARAADGDPRLLLAQAIAIDNAGQHAQALKLYRKVWGETKDPQGGNNAAFIISQLYPKDTVRLNEALGWAEHAVGAAPEEPTFRDTRGWILFLLGKTDQGRGNVRQALKNAPTSPEIHYHAGMIEASLGDEELGRWHFQAAIDHAETIRAAGGKLTDSTEKTIKLAAEALKKTNRKEKGETRPDTPRQ